LIPFNVEVGPFLSPIMNQKEAFISGVKKMISLHAILHPALQSGDPPLDLVQLNLHPHLRRFEQFNLIFDCDEILTAAGTPASARLVIRWPTHSFFTSFLFSIIASFFIVLILQSI
jgi:hypothetical protein